MLAGIKGINSAWELNHLPLLGMGGASQASPVFAAGCAAARLINQEIYEEPGVSKRTRPLRLDQSSFNREFTAQEMIDILQRSGYEGRKIDLGYMWLTCPKISIIEVFLILCET
jgi:hypothetical protein